MDLARDSSSENNPTSSNDLSGDVDVACDSSSDFEVDHQGFKDDEDDEECKPIVEPTKENCESLNTLLHVSCSKYCSKNCNLNASLLTEAQIEGLRSTIMNKNPQKTKNNVKNFVTMSAMSRKGKLLLYFNENIF